MENRKSLLARLWRKFVPEKPAPPALPAKLAPLDPPKAQAARRPPRSSIESLEGRIAPALVLPGGRGIVFVDSDHDVVTVTFSKAVLSGVPTSTLNNVFKFSNVSETFIPGDTPDFEQLQLIDLTKLPEVNGVSSAQGVSMKISVIKIDNGDGHTAIGGISANGISLGDISIPGDLGFINCGDGATVNGLHSLTVDSLGVRTDTQVGAGLSNYTPTYQSLISGGLGAFKANVVEGAFLDVKNGFQKVAAGKIGSISIANELRARIITSADGTAGADDGVIESASDIGSISIGGGFRDSTLGSYNSDGILGGLGVDSGSIVSLGKIGKITINGDIHGGDGANSGFISSMGDIGDVSILGKVTGGSGKASGSIASGAAMGAVDLGGSYIHDLVGGAGDNSGQISSVGKMGVVTITGDIRGGAAGANPVSGSTAQHSGGILAGGALAGINITGSVIGGAGVDSGSVEGKVSIGAIKVGGSLTGGAGANSGYISSVGDMGTVSILGQVTGGNGSSSGSVASGAAMGAVNLGSSLVHDLVGGTGDNSGQISSVGNMGKVTIIGDIRGGTAGPNPIAGSNAQFSGGVLAGGALAGFEITGSVFGGGGLESGLVESMVSIGDTKVGGSLMGGAGTNSGSIVSGGAISSVSVGIALSGGAGVNSGSLFSATTGSGKLGAVDIGGASSTGVGERGLIGGAGDDSGSLIAGDAVKSVTIHGLAISGVTTALSGGAGHYSGAIYSGGSLGGVNITGDLRGAAGDFSASIGAHVLLSSLTLRGDALGGAGVSSASVTSLDSADGLQGGAIGKIVGQKFVGGAGDNSGQIRADAGIASITLSTLSATSADGILSGSIVSGAGLAAPGNIGSITLGHLEGPVAVDGKLKVDGAINVNGHLGSLAVSNGITNASVHVSDDVASVSVNGDVTGSVITARGQAAPGKKSDVAIGKISISGAVANSEFLAGYLASIVSDGAGGMKIFEYGVNGSAQIGSVTVGKTWTASDLAAGVGAGTDNDFGTTDDATLGGGTAGIVSRIASVVIKQGVQAAAGDSGHYGFDAGQIGTFKNGSASINVSATAPANIPITGVTGVAIELI